MYITVYSYLCICGYVCCASIPTYTPHCLPLHIYIPGMLSHTHMTHAVYTPLPSIHGSINISIAVNLAISHGKAPHSRQDF